MKEEYDDVVMDDDDVPVYDPYLVSLSPKVTALLSMIGSYVLIREVLEDHKERRGKPVARILLAMSVADIFFSLAWLLSTWMAPAELDFLWANFGNQATCTFQGFILQFGLMASPCFNLALTIFYTLIVRYNWKDSQLEKIELYVHGVIWLFSLAASVVPLFFGLYNSAWEVCWIDSYPYGCNDSWTYGDEGDCERGDNAWIWAISFTVFPLWFGILADIVLMIIIYRTVRSMENTSLKYATSITSKRRNPEAGTSTAEQEREANHAKSKAVATQAILFVIAFLVTYSFDFIATVIYETTGTWNDWFDLFAYMIMPLQGFFNCLIFIRNRKNMKTAVGRLFRRWVCCACCAKFMAEEEEEQPSNYKTDTNASSSVAHQGRPEITARQSGMNEQVPSGDELLSVQDTGCGSSPAVDTTRNEPLS